jgi:hypothetical protein
LFGPAAAIRARDGFVRFEIFDASFESPLAKLGDELGEKGFESSWAEGAALSTDEAIAYAQRRRGARKRPSSGWATVQTHLTHVYNKHGFTSGVQLAQEAARHTQL